MTERERRALGLPPHPSEVALLESIRKDAEERMFQIAKIVDSPALKMVAEQASRFQETMRELTRPSESIPAIRFTPRTVRLDPDQFRDLVSRPDRASVNEKVSADLLYNFKEKILSRQVAGATLISRFNGDGAKRAQLLERLLRHKGYVDSADLREELECPSGDAVRKLVQGINKKIMRDLNISENIIEGRASFGYRINPTIPVHHPK